MSEEIRTEMEEVMDLTETDDANDGFRFVDGVILGGIAAAGYGVGKGIEYTTKKLVPKIKSKVADFKEKRKSKKDGKVVEHEASNKDDTKKSKEKNQKSKETTED